ncbi:TadE/TadG family type IV pilus assembly protein [Rhizobium sp. ARZ01]|uniref:TadE/TadG family type IV pilus assembly protein n=1 Tax=Rhizobium sp. ARZ01 TaxID=2769313 RepID=UPI001FEFD5ED|nr:TadE/TadG family type IV pilus assembly protein [Rhizobium sp. ARZ01]
MKRFLGERQGATAIEFAIGAPVFFAVVFAILETFVAYMAGQVLLNANDAIARQIRLGQITFNTGRSTDVENEAAFRKKYCAELTILVTCSLEEIEIPSKLEIDVVSVPLSGLLTAKESKFERRYAPGGKSSTNLIRAKYHWPVIVDYLRLLPPNSSLGASHELVATAVVQNEDYK